MKPNTALARIRRYVDMRAAKPLLSLTDEVHNIHTGTEWAASLCLSDLQEVVSALPPKLHKGETPRTDAIVVGIATRASCEPVVALARQLERELAAMEKRAMDCVAMNERQAVNFAACQRELAEMTGAWRVEKACREQAEAQRSSTAPNLEAENEVLREQNFAMNKTIARLSATRPSVEWVRGSELTPTKEGDYWTCDDRPVLPRTIYGAMRWTPNPGWHGSTPYWWAIPTPPTETATKMEKP